MPVNVTEIEVNSIEEFVVSTADVRALNAVNLVSQSDGYYRLNKNPRSGISFKAGDQVKDNEIIVYLDNPEYENSIGLESKQLNLEISEREFEKQQSLYDKGGVTLRELKNAERALIDARYAYENAKLQLEKLRVRAPFDGLITQLTYYTPGVLLNVNQPIAEVMDYSEMLAEVEFPARELSRIKEGQKVRVTQYNLPGDTLIGVINQVDPALDQNSRSFSAKVILDNQNLKLRPGMFVKLETVVASKDSTIVIPKEIIISRRSGKTVFIVDKGAAFQRTISTGLENDNFVEVTEGLKKGDRLVIKGFETLRHRSKVKIVR